MIKFFRRFRQKMLSKNKSSQYLLYAIGEIVLVVIGILIALSINNWNEERKTKSNAENYINKIINDLSVDTLNINASIVLSDTFETNISTYFDEFNSSDSLNIPIDSLIVNARGVTARYIKYYPVNQSFKDMESSGNGNLLTDTQRDFLIALNAKQEELGIIIDNYLETAIDEAKISLQLLGDPGNFYTKLNLKNSLERKTQGLLHIHLGINARKNMYRYIESRGKIIIKLSHEAIVLLKQNKYD